MGKLIKSKNVKIKPVRLSEHYDQQLENIIARQDHDKNLFFNSKQRIIDLSLIIAKRIVETSITLDPKIIDQIYHQTIKETAETKNAIITVHPEDKKNSQIDKIAQNKGFMIVEDSSVGKAGCIIETKDITISRSVDHLLMVFKKAMEQTSCD